MSAWKGGGCRLHLFIQERVFSKMEVTDETRHNLAFVTLNALEVCSTEADVPKKFAWLPESRAGTL